MRNSVHLCAPAGPFVSFELIKVDAVNYTGYEQLLALLPPPSIVRNCAPCIYFHFASNSEYFCRLMQFFILKSVHNFSSPFAAAVTIKLAPHAHRNEKIFCIHCWYSVVILERL